jgi:hypothetical protein
MTVSGMSSTYYNIYKFSVNQAQKVNAVDPFKIIKNDVSVDDITNSLNLVKIATNSNNKSIANLDSFIKNTSPLIQSYSYDAPSNIKNRFADIFNVSNNNARSMAYIMDKFNISSNFTNINSALNITSASQFIDFKHISSANRLTSNRNANTYTYYLNTTVNGSLFNGMA